MSNNHINKCNCPVKGKGRVDIVCNVLCVDKKKRGGNMLEKHTAQAQILLSLLGSV